MIAAVTARTRTRRKGRDHIQLAPSARHNDHTTPREQAPRVHLPGSQPAAGDRLASFAYLALGGLGWKKANANLTRGAAHSLRGVPRLDRQALVAPAGPRPPLLALASSDPTPGALDVRAQSRSWRLAQRGHRAQRALRRLADALVVGLRDQRGPSLVFDAPADASGRAWLSRVRLFTGMASRSVVSPRLSRIRIT